jgi:hypothetical protein
MKASDIIIVVIIVLIYYECKYSVVYDTFTSNKVKSDVDKRFYGVSNAFSNQTDASNTMANINLFIFDFLKFLRNKFIFNKSGHYYEQEFVKRLLENYNPDVIFENNPKSGEDTSYVTNKGDKFAVCLRNKKTNKIHDYNLLQFVTIHELSHLGNVEYGHGYSFWAWMKFMLIQAHESGLYIPRDYSKTPIVYCGLQVTFSPYFSNKYNWHSLYTNQLS